MKFCYTCGHWTAGKPLFCNFCGGSYDVKLCPKLHTNPRFAEACSQCGSRNLSVPQPRIPLSWRILVLIAHGVCILLLLAFSLPIALAFLTALLRHAPIGNRLFLGILLVILLWSLWAMLPDACRWTIHRLLIRKSGLVDGPEGR
jgi:hypothetical protein